MEPDSDLQRTSRKIGLEWNHRSDQGSSPRGSGVGSGSEPLVRVVALLSAERSVTGPPTSPVMRSTRLTRGVSP